MVAIYLPRPMTGIYESCMPISPITLLRLGRKDRYRQGPIASQYVHASFSSFSWSMLCWLMQRSSRISQSIGPWAPPLTWAHTSPLWMSLFTPTLKRRAESSEQMGDKDWLVKTADKFVGKVFIVLNFTRPSLKSLSGWPDRHYIQLKARFILLSGQSLVSIFLLLSENERSTCACTCIAKWWRTLDT